MVRGTDKAMGKGAGCGWDGASDEYGGFSWLVEMGCELVSDPLMARTWAGIPLSVLVPFPAAFPWPISCRDIWDEGNMMGAYSNPNIGLMRELTLDNKLIASSHPFPSPLPASPTRPRPSPCYRTQRSIVVAGGKDEENCVGTRVLPDAEARGGRRWSGTRFPGAPCRCSLLAPPSCCPKAVVVRNGMVGIPMVEAIHGPCPFVPPPYYRGGPAPPLCPSQTRDPPFPISFPPSCVSWAILSLSTCSTLDAVAVFLSLFFPLFTSPSPWKSRSLHKPQLLRRPALSGVPLSLRFSSSSSFASTLDTEF